MSEQGDVAPKEIPEDLSDLSLAEVHLTDGVPEMALMAEGMEMAVIPSSAPSLSAMEEGEAALTAAEPLKKEEKMSRWKRLRSRWWAPGAGALAMALGLGLGLGLGLVIGYTTWPPHLCEQMAAEYEDRIDVLTSGLQAFRSHSANICFVPVWGGPILEAPYGVQTVCYEQPLGHWVPVRCNPDKSSWMINLWTPQVHIGIPNEPQGVTIEKEIGEDRHTLRPATAGAGTAAPPRETTVEGGHRPWPIHGFGMANTTTKWLRTM